MTTAYLAQWWPTVATAMICALASCAVGLTEILHGPELPNYRKAPLFVRLSMMAWSITLAFRSFDLVAGLVKGHPQEVGVTAVMAGITMLGYVYAVFWDTASKRLPARFWRHLERAVDLATCRPWWAGFRQARRNSNAAVQPGSPMPVLAPTKDAAVALGELQQLGFRVAAPGERQRFED